MVFGGTRSSLAGCVLRGRLTARMFGRTLLRCRLGIVTMGVGPLSTRWGILPVDLMCGGSLGGTSTRRLLRTRFAVLVAARLVLGCGVGGVIAAWGLIGVRFAVGTAG